METSDSNNKECECFMESNFTEVSEYEMMKRELCEMEIHEEPNDSFSLRREGINDMLQFHNSNMLSRINKGHSKIIRRKHLTYKI